MKYKYLNKILLDWNHEEDLQDNNIIKSSDIKSQIDKCFIYKIENKPSKIKIFGDGTIDGWPEFKKYKDKVYINSKHVELTYKGNTVDKFEPGEYRVYIEDIDQVKNTKRIFYKCHQLVKAYIPNSVTTIGDNAFFGCTRLTSITIPSSVISIGGGVFIGCRGLTNVTIPNSVTSIDYAAFYKCSGLTSVTIGNSVTSIGGSAFEDCSGLTSVTIPSSVILIGYDAFENCSGLKEIYIPKSVKKIYCDAFNGCNKLKTIYIEDINKYKRSIGKNTDPVNWNDAKLIELKK